MHPPDCLTVCNFGCFQQDEFPEESQDESEDDVGMNCNDQIGKAFKMEVLDF